MFQAISEIVKNVAIIILLTTFLDMLLPNNNMQRFIKVIMGLFVMLAIINPIIELLDNDLELTAWQLSLPKEETVDTVLAQGSKLRDISENQALVEYKGRIEKQLEALVGLMPEVGQVKSSVLIEPENKIGSLGKIEKITVWLSLTQNNKVNNEATDIKVVEPVEIEINQAEIPTRVEKAKAQEDQQVKEKVVNIISNYYGVDKNSIDIVFY